SGIAIFEDELDYRAFTGLLKAVASKHGWKLIAYCLMTNHFHLVVEACGADLSQGMSALNGRYAQRFNNRHKPYGHLFQGRYDARPVGDDRFTDVREYVMQNPVRAGLVAEGEDYPWSALLIPE